MQKTKSILSSKTIWGALALAVLSYLGFTDAELNPILEAIATASAFGLTVYGRIKAKLPLKAKLPGTANILTLAITVAALSAGLGVATQTGCQAIEKFAQDNPAATRLIKGALHLAADSIVAANPEYQKYLATVNTAIDRAFAPDRPPGARANTLGLLLQAALSDNPRALEAFTRGLAVGVEEAAIDPAGSTTGPPASDADRVAALHFAAQLRDAATLR